VFRLVVQEPGFLGEPLSDDSDASPLVVNLGERCLICLADYETSDEVRRLDKCKHVYHRECIDEWLTTGRNSCPMCRGQGVLAKGASVSGNANPVASSSI